MAKAIWSVAPRARASETRERLLEFFRLPNERLAALLGRSLPWTR